MTKQDLFSYQDTMASITKDIHKACEGMEVSVLWDDGKFGVVTGTHQLKVWNNLGSVEVHVEHADLLEKGNKYKGLLAMIAARAQKDLRI